MAISLILLPATLISLFISLTLSQTLISPTDHQTPSFCPDQLSQKPLEREVEEAKLKIARLESILDDRIADIDAKSRYFSDCEKKIDELITEIDRLKTAVSSFEHDYSLRLTALEEEVRLLWAASRKNNFEIYALEHKAVEAESRLEEISSRVGEMTEIVSEQWIQIQRLEQAVHMAEMRTLQVKMELWKKCPFVKFFTTLYGDCLETLKGIIYPCVSRYGPVLGFCKSRALQAFAAAKNYHHQLQGSIRHAMKSNELTSALAHKEVVFFVASALVAFPLMSVCLFLLSQFS